MAVMEMGQESTTTVDGNTMKAIVSRAVRAPDVLELRDVDKPVIGDDQVLVRVHASSVNPAEWYGVTGPYFARVRKRSAQAQEPTVGADLAGGSKPSARTSRSFNRVTRCSAPRAAPGPSTRAAREVRLAPKPANVSFEEAAAVPVAALTALQALRDKGGSSPGRRF